MTRPSDDSGTPEPLKIDFGSSSGSGRKPSGGALPSQPAPKAPAASKPVPGDATPTGKPAATSKPAQGRAAPAGQPPPSQRQATDPPADELETEQPAEVLFPMDSGAEQEKVPTIHELMQQMGPDADEFLKSEKAAQESAPSPASERPTSSAPEKPEPRSGPVASRPKQEPDPGKGEERSTETPEPPAEKKKVRAALPILGLAAIAGAFFAAPGLFPAPPEPEGLGEIRMVVTSEPNSDVYRDGELLGRTPLLVVQQSEGETLRLSQDGFVEQTVTYHSASPTRVGKVALKLVSKDPPEEEPGQPEVSPDEPQPGGTTVGLDWTGLEEGAQLIWDGRPTTPGELTSATPGDHRIEVTPSEGPPVDFAISIEPSALEVEKPLKLGQAYREQLARRGTLLLTLRVPPSSSGAVTDTTLAVEIKELSREHYPYQTHVSINTERPTPVVLPRAGKYSVGFAGTQDYAVLVEEVDVSSGRETTHFVTLEALPSQPEDTIETPSDSPPVQESPNPEQTTVPPEDSDSAPAEPETSEGTEETPTPEGSE